jgi:hypothetical protein
MPLTEKAPARPVMSGSLEQEMPIDVYEATSRKVEQNTDIM